MLSPNAPATRLFKLFGTPVYVQGSFLFLVLLFTFQELMVGRLDLVFAVAVALFVSVLVHEFGHVFAARTNGFRSQVVLWGLGGFTVPDGQVQGWRDVWMSFAGPLFGLVLWAIVWFGFMPAEAAALGLKLDLGAMFSPYGVLDVAYDDYELTVGHELWATLVWLNLILSIFNLLPIHPLDGGHIAYSLARMRMRAFEATQVTGWVGFVCAIGVAGWLYWAADGRIGGILFALILLGFLAWSNWERAHAR